MTGTDLKTKLSDWATAQSFNNLLLLMILVGGGLGLKFVMVEAIPLHLEKMQKGYELIDEKHREERRVIREQFNDWLERILEDRPVKTGALNSWSAEFIN